jgi:hypothetical protein
MTLKLSNFLYSALKEHCFSPNLIDIKLRYNVTTLSTKLVFENLNRLFMFNQVLNQ